MGGWEGGSNGGEDDSFTGTVGGGRGGGLLWRVGLAPREQSGVDWKVDWKVVES